MHELSIVAEVVKNAQKVAVDNKLTVIDSITLQIGEISSVVPKYIKECYKAVIDGSNMKNTKLNIEILPANAICKGCNKVFHLPENKERCPHCGSAKYEIISGKELFIKEIVAY